MAHPPCATKSIFGAPLKDISLVVGDLTRAPPMASTEVHRGKTSPASRLDADEVVPLLFVDRPASIAQSAEPPAELLFFTPAPRLSATIQNRRRSSIVARRVWLPARGQRGFNVFCRLP